MSAQMDTELEASVSPHKDNPPAENRNRWAAGIGLIVIGVLALVAQFADLPALGRLFLLALGVVFLIWGIVVRSVGLLIPGGILGGLGLGVYLISGPVRGVSDTLEGAVFMLAFAFGWGLITLLSAFVDRRVHWWPLIPGGIMALIGGGLLVGGPALDALEWLGKLWPLALVGFGLYIILRRNR